MSKLKFEISKELRLHLEEMRDVLGGDPDPWPEPPDGGCSNCTQTCGVSCSAECTNSCVIRCVTGCGNCYGLT